jgi:arylsulfatase A-like enzyme
MYEDISIPEPRLSDPEIYESQPEFLKASINRERYFWRWDTPEKYQANMRAYYRMISGIDKAIQRVVGVLEEKGLAGNTVIIYSADNGYYMGDRGFAGKWSHYEQSLRVPLIVHDPRLPDSDRGRVNTSLTLNVDIPATILDLAGIPVPDLYQGESLMPLVIGESEDNGREDFLCEHLWDIDIIPKWEGVRSKRYVYARYFGQEPPYEFLHDLETDPDQLINYAGDENQADILNRLREKCDDYILKYSMNTF